MDNYTWTQLKTSIIGPSITYQKKWDPHKISQTVKKVWSLKLKSGAQESVTPLQFVVISWPPPLISQLFYPMSHLFLQLGCFCVDYYYYIQSTEFRAHLASTYLNCKLCFYCCIQSWQCTVCCLILCAKSTTKFKMKISKIFGNAHSVVLWILQCAHTLPCIQARGLIQYDMCLYCSSCS